MMDTSLLALQLLSATLSLEGSITLILTIILIITIIYYTPQEDS